MSRRLMLRNASGGGILPSEYQQVEWISSPSINDYIITDIPTSANGVLYADFELVASGQFAFGNAVGSAYKGFNIYNDVNRKYGTYPNNQKIGDYTNGQFELFATLNSGTASGEGNGFQFNISYNLGDTDPYAIFRCNAYKTNPVLTSALRSLVFEISGGLTHNFIPCYRKSDGVIGLYNTGNNVFYTNAGTGTFTKGADV